MKKKAVGTVLLALASFAVGLESAQRFFRLFRSTVPPVALGSFQVGAAHAAFLTYGVVLGVVIFGLGVLTYILSPMFRGSIPDRDAQAGSPAASRE